MHNNCNDDFWEIKKRITEEQQNMLLYTRSLRIKG